ncbi:F-box domain containing protein [Tanacetum coccineum]
MQEEFPDWFGSQIRQRHVDNDQDPEQILYAEASQLVDDDGVEKVYSSEMSSADVARSYGGDGGGDDHPPSHVVTTGCGGCFANKVNEKPNLGRYNGEGRLNTRERPKPFAKGRLTVAKEPLVVQECAVVLALLEKDPRSEGGRSFSVDLGPVDLRPHMDSSSLEEISEGFNMSLQKSLQYHKVFSRPSMEGQTPTNGSTIEASGGPSRGDIQRCVEAGLRTLQEYPSSFDTFGDHICVIEEEMKRLEATGEYTEDEINALARGGKLRGHIPGVGRVLPSRATSRPSMPAPDKSLKSMHRKVDFMMSLFRSDSKYSDMFKEFESGGASGSGGCGDDEEGGDDEDGDMGPTSSLGIIAGERIPHEASPASIPQRHVAGESPDMSPGKQAIVVVWWPTETCDFTLQPVDIQSILDHCGILGKEVRLLKLNLAFMNRKDSEQTKQIEELQQLNEDI